MQPVQVPIHPPNVTRPGVRRRWILVAVVVLVFLCAYALALAWLGRRLESDLQKSIHPVPTVLSAQRTGD